MELRGVYDRQERISSQTAYQKDEQSTDLNQPEFTSTAALMSNGVATLEAHAWRHLKKSYRRLMNRADQCIDQNRLCDAETSLLEGLGIALDLHERAPDDRWLLRDIARIHYGVSQVKRQQGFLDDALSAIRACHDMIERLANIDPSHIARQNNLTISHAAIRDTLEEKGDRRLAVAAARFAVISAERVADLFDHRPDLRHEIIRQRLALATLLDDGNNGSKARIACLRLACGTAKELPLQYAVSDDVWTEVRRVHLDLANALQLTKQYDETIEILEEFRGYAMLRLVSGPNEIAQNNTVALADYLKGLVFVMKREYATAIGCFVKGLGLYDAIPIHIFLTDEVQQQRAKLLGEAMKAAEHASDKTLKPMIEKLSLRRLKAILQDKSIGAHYALDVMARTHELARMLIVKQVPHLALHCLSYAETILISQSSTDDNPIFVQRWAGFLKLEEGRAFGAMSRVVEAQTALRKSLVLNEDLWAANPEDVRAQCDIAYAEWQLAPHTPSSKREHLRRSRAILRMLDRSGRLPEYAKPWLDEIERDLRVA